MRLVFIQPGRMQMAQHTIDQATKPWLPPSSLLVVAGMTPDKIGDESIDLLIWDETTSMGPFNFDQANPDVIALTGLTTSRLRMYQIATEAKKRSINVIAGGMDTSGHFADGFDQELLSFYDAIVVGRLTHRLWTKILSDLLSKKLDKVYRVEPDEPWEFAPFRYDLIDFSRYVFLTLATSQGCPNSCSFCGVHLICGRQVHLKPEKDIKTDIKNIKSTSRGLIRSRLPVVIIDDSYGMSLEHTKKVLPCLKEDLKQSWLCETTAKNLTRWITDNGVEKPFFQLLRENGCSGVYIGFETIVGKIGAKSISPDEIIELVKKLHDFGFLVLGAFVFGGFDEEDKFFEHPDVFDRTAEFVILCHLDGAQFSSVYPIPGTPFRRQILNQNRFMDFNPEHGDGAWPTILHPFITPEEMFEGLHRVYRSVFNSKERISHAKTTFPWWKREIIYMATKKVKQKIDNWWTRANFKTWEATRLATQKAYNQFIETL